MNKKNYNKNSLLKMFSKINLIFLLLSSFFFSIYYGYRGIFPIDSFLIFDAGHKILNNFHPFKDYWSITGPFLDYFQFFLFYLIGINWFSYVLHAAIINCLLATTSYYFFLKIKIKRNFALLYSLSIAILAYPTTGTPFMDHHAVFFSALSIIFLTLSFLKNDKKFWFFSSFLLIFSFFSKQIPSAYFGFTILLSIIFYLLIDKNYKNKNFLFFILGGFVGLLLFFILFYFNEVPLKDLYIQYFLYPIAVGGERLENIAFDFKNVFLQFKFIYLSIIPLFYVVFILLRRKSLNKSVKIDLLIIFLFISSFCVYLYTQIITKNQILIFFLIPFFLGISHYYVNKYYNKKFIINLIILVLVFSTIKYHMRFNEHKKFMDLQSADFSKSVDANILDEKLNGLKWITPHYLDNPELELKLLIQVKQVLINDNEKNIIISDYQILPAITKNYYIAPNKWFDQRSVPSKNSKFFLYYKEFFVSKLRSQKIDNIYVIGEDKKIFLSSIFNNKKCLNYKMINEISFKLKVKNCY